MSITLWKAPFQLFASVSPSATGDAWLRSRIAQTNDPLIVDALTPAGAASGSTVDDVIYAQAENWLGDTQAAVKIAATGNVALPFADFAATFVTASGGTDTDAVFWWSQPAINSPGSFDLDFQQVSDTPLTVDASTPALTTVSSVTPLNIQFDPSGNQLSA